MSARRKAHSKTILRLKTMGIKDTTNLSDSEMEMEQLKVCSVFLLLTKQNDERETDRQTERDRERQRDRDRVMEEVIKQ